MDRIVRGQEGEDGELDDSDEEDDTDLLWSCGDAPEEELPSLAMQKFSRLRRAALEIPASRLGSSFLKSR